MYYPYVTAMSLKSVCEGRGRLVPTNSVRGEKKNRGVVPRTTRDPPELSKKKKKSKGLPRDSTNYGVLHTSPNACLHTTISVR